MNPENALFHDDKDTWSSLFPPNVRCAPTGIVERKMKRNWNFYGRLVRHDLLDYLRLLVIVRPFAKN